MSEHIEECGVCGIRDALGRHASYCSRALDLGLDRLAEGESAIPVIEEELLPPEGLPAPVRPPEDAVLTPSPQAAKRQLWLAYYEDFSDVIVFDDELAALRHAVNGTSMRVKALELGKSVRDQITGRRGRSRGEVA